jgi:hypothetical protein
MNTVSRKISADASVFFPHRSGAAPYSCRREPLESRPRAIDLDQKWKGELFRPPSTGLSPRGGTRDAPRLLSHSTRPWLPQSPAAGLSKRGRCCSAPSFEGKPQLRLCVAARLAGSRRHAAPDWKVRHGHLTSQCGPKFHTPYRTLSISSAVVARRAVWSGHIRPRGSPTPSVKAAIAFKDVIADLPFFRPGCMTA